MREIQRSFIHSFNFFLKRNAFFLPLILIAILIPLLFRNPFSERTLIPNFEPFPDAFYYVTPPLCLLDGQGWSMCRLHDESIAGITPVVTPLYSLSLLPSLWLFNDARGFYFSNVILTFASVLLLYRLVNKIFKNEFIGFFIAVLYLTNSYIYWLPTLAMAENVLLTIFLLAANLLLLSYSLKKTVLLSVVSVSFFATKKAAAPLTVALLLATAISILTSKQDLKRKLKHIFYSISTSVIILSLFTDLSPLLALLRPLVSEAVPLQAETTSASSPGYFSFQYFFKHIAEYSSIFGGKPLRFLWRHEALISPLTALSAIAGIKVYAVEYMKKRKELNPLIIFFALALLAQLGFMSMFYVVDARYLVIWLPIALVLVSFVVAKLTLKTPQHMSITIFALFFLLLAVQRGMPLKEQVSLNLKYAETPWWYLSIQELNSFIAEKHSDDQYTPYVITLVSPFMTDYFSENEYKTLPLDSQQDFRGHKKNVWGTEHDYNDLHQLYAKLSTESPVYVARYGVEGSDRFRDSFAAIEKEFELTIVHEGCHSLCNIYSLSIKDDT